MQFPFDRLIETVDKWAGAAGRTDVVAQTGPSSYVPKHIEAHAFLSPEDFAALLDKSALAIAHCGMGSILSALSRGKPILVMPRSAAKGEHRNEHQLATAQRVAEWPGVTVARDETELLCILRSARRADYPALTPIAAKAPRELTDRLRSFLHGGC